MMLIIVELVATCAATINCASMVLVLARLEFLMMTTIVDLAIPNAIVDKPVKMELVVSSLLADQVGLNRDLPY